MTTLPMTLQEATDRVIDAIEAENFEALSRALTARRAALQSVERPGIEAFEAGERAIRALKDLAQRIAFDSARLGQIKRYVEFRR
jgi:hypothetical protein